MTTIFIRNLWIYPVKALGGIAVSEAKATEGGSFEGDREWVVVNGGGEKLWQGIIPKMALIGTRLTPTTLILDAPDRAPVEVARDHRGAPATVTMHGETLNGVDAGDVVADWLSASLGVQARLVRLGAHAHNWNGLNPVHVTSDSSLAALNQALRAGGHHAIEMGRFRPNLVLGSDGEITPFFEEKLEPLQFGETVLRWREPCVRCQLPNINRNDGRREKQPLKMIGTMSKTRPDSVPAAFGMYAQVNGADALNVGMRTEVRHSVSMIVDAGGYG